jgi:hypothetical protein
MLGISIPCALIAFAIFSPIYGKFDRHRKFWIFESFPFIFLIFIFSLPTTPKHDGIRLFSLAWPHLIMLSIRGACGIGQLINRLVFNRLVALENISAIRTEMGVITALLILTLLTNVLALAKYHPYQLSYYNAAIGGPAGAATKGFAISYWYEALDRTFFSKLNDRYKNDSITIFSYPNSDILEYNRVLGLVGPRIKSASNPHEADYLLILNRIIRRSMFNYLQGKETAMAASTPDSVWILSLFDNHKSRPKHAFTQWKRLGSNRREQDGREIKAFAHP